MSKVTEIYRDAINPTSTFGINVSSEKNQNKSNETKKSEEKGFIQKQVKDRLDLNISKNDDASSTYGKKELSDGEKKLVEQYKNIDRKVRAHEAAHRSAGAGLVRGGTTYKYEVGPDGKRYAVAGEVKIDLSYDLDDPEATIRKMQQVRRAALAPSDPSPQDRAVATKAANIEARARRELQKQRSENDNNSISLVKNKYDNSNNDILIGSIFNGIF